MAEEEGLSPSNTPPTAGTGFGGQAWAHQRALIHNEVTAVTNALRKYQRWNAGYSRRTSPLVAPDLLAYQQQQYHTLPRLLALPSPSMTERAALQPPGTTGPWRDGLATVLQLTCDPASVNLASASQFSPSTSMSLSSASEHPIISRFAHLYSRLEYTRAGQPMDPVELADPFLEIIKSGDSSGSITGSALSALTKFIHHKCFDFQHPKMQKALLLMSHAVTRCRFEASDSLSSDEVVLDLLLTLIQTMVAQRELECLIDDKGVCEMLEVAFGIFFQNRASELLRHSAEQALLTLVSAVFRRLPALQEDMVRKQRPCTFSRDPAVVAAAPPAPGASTAALHVSFSEDAGASANTSAGTVSEAEEVMPTRPSMLRAPTIRHIEEDGKRPIGTLSTIISVSLDQAEDTPALSSTHSHANLPPSAEESVQSGTPGYILPDTPGYSVPASAEATPGGPYGAASRSGILIHEQQFERRHSLEVKVIDVHEQHGGAGGGGPGEEGEGGKEGAESAEIILSSTTDTIRHFGMPSILELVRVLIALMDIRNVQHTDALHRSLAIKLGDVAVEVGGEALGQLLQLGQQASMTPAASRSPEERSIVAFAELMRELLRHLFQLLEVSAITVQNQPTSFTLQIVYGTLRTIVGILSCSGDAHKLPREWLIQWIIRKLEAGIVTWDVEGRVFAGADHAGTASHHPSSSPAASGQHAGGSGASSISTTGSTGSGAAPSRGDIVVGDVRELLLKTLLQLSRSPTFMADLYYNYDGGERVQSHLFEELVLFLARNAFPDATPGGSVTTPIHQSLCLDALLMFLGRLDPGQRVGERDAEAIQHIRDVKRLKRIHLKGAQLFNSKPKEGIAYLQEHGVLPVPVDAGSIARFLSGSAIVDKKLLGEYLSRPVNGDILKAFVGMYDFKGKRIDEGLRLLLESFRLPGESQQIEKVMETFAHFYFVAQDPGHHEIETQDATFILAYSLIMLNTDQHNPQVRRRMTLQDFIKNNRGINAGKNFSPDYLQQVFNAIKEAEIVMPEEHEGALGFHYKWTQVMKRAPVAGPLRTCPVAVDRELFSLSWPAVVAAISYALDNAEDNLVLQKAVIGLHQCATFAAAQGMTAAFDSIIISLSKVSGISKGSHHGPSSGGSGGGDSAKGGRHWVLAFARNYRGRVAAALMFHLAAQHPNALVEGWSHVVEDVANLFLHDLLPPALQYLQVEAGLRDEPTTIPISKYRPPVPESSASSAKKEINLFSTLTHFLSLSSGAGGEEEEAGDYAPEEVEVLERVAADFLDASPILPLLDPAALSLETQRLVVQALIRSSIYPDPGGPGAGSPGAEDAVAYSPYAPVEVRGSKFRECCIFNMQLMLRFVAVGPSEVWDDVFAHVRGFVEELPATTLAPAGIFEQVLDCLFKLLRTPHLAFERKLQCLQYLSTLPNQRIAWAPIPFARGVAGALREGRFTGELWKPFYSLLAAISTMPETAGIGFEMLLLLIAEVDVMLTPENFGDVVDILIINSGGGGAGSGANERAIVSLEKLYALHEHIPRLTSQSDMMPKRAWFEFWLPILSGLGQQCYHPLKEVRQHAFAYLQRALLSPELEASAANASLDTWVHCFENVLFPLLDELLQDDFFKIDKAGTNETRLGACSLLCKIFLQFLPRLEAYAELDLLWIKLLEYLKKFMLKNETKSGVLYEGVLESLKNLLLVMSTHSCFQDQDAQEFGPVHLWKPTWDVLNPILPTLKDELFPAPGAQDPAHPSTGGNFSPRAPKTPMNAM